MRLSNELYEFIKGEVVAVFEQYDVRCIPINGFNLACKMKMKLIPYSPLAKEKQMAAMELSKDGFYMEDIQGNNIIYYNDNILYERLNMTLLHEIGHCVLDHTGRSDEEEAEASFFAKYAAAPPPLIHRLSDKSVESIAQAFCISITAAYIAREYYLKWLAYGGNWLRDYEVTLLRLFNAG